MHASDSPKKYRISKASLTIKVDSTLDCNLESLEKEIRDWADYCDIEIIDQPSLQTRNLYNIKLNLIAGRNNDGLYWHAVTGECLLNKNDNPTSEATEQKNTNLQIAKSFHFIGQNNTNLLKEHIRDTLIRSFNELTFANPSKIKKSPEWIRKSLRMYTALIDTFTIDFNLEPLKVVKQPPAPAYPTLAQQRMIQGTVVIGLLVDTSGKPSIAEALSGPNELLEAAMAYALTWEFEPAMLNGNARPGSFKLTLPFKLQ